MAGADEVYGVVDVLDDFAPIDARELALLDVFAGEAVAFDEFAGFVIATAMLDFGFDGFVNFGVVLLRVAKSLAEESDVIVDLDDAAFCSQGFNPGIAHVARGVAKGATRGVRGDQRGLAES